MSFEEKQAIVWRKGMFLERQPKENEALQYNFLYGIDKFYVELVYDIPTNKIVDIRSFKTGQDLEKYLSNIETKY